jgi:7-keto-8-aminopelargonate synthetase-like enzyme
MIIGSLSGPLCAGGGFCAGSKEVVEHQRITSSAYTYSAALPAILAVTASSTIGMVKEGRELARVLRENVKTMREQLDPRSNWVRCSSVPENPILLLVIKDEHVKARGLTFGDQEVIMQEVVDDVSFPICQCYS